MIVCPSLGSVASSGLFEKMLPPAAVYSYIFKEEDLDNEDVISMVETSPTYKRSKETLRQLMEIGSSRANTVEPGTTILFG